MRLKGIIGTGLVMVGSGMAGFGFGKRDTKLACLGTFVMGLGTLFITDDHADVINHNVKIMSEIGDVVNDHEARLRQMEK